MSKSYGNSDRADGRAGRHRASRSGGSSPTPRRPAQPKDPDACTLVALLRAFADPATVADVEERYRDRRHRLRRGQGAARGRHRAHVAPLRDRYERLLTDPAELDDRLVEGERHAGRRADRVLARAMAAMGL